MSQNLENAIADMKRQLRTESKSALIRQWIGLYAQVIQLSEENQKLKVQLKQNTVASAPANNEGESK